MKKTFCEAVSSIENTSTDHLTTYKVYLALAFFFPRPDVTLKKKPESDAKGYQ